MLCRKTFARPFVLAAALGSMFTVVQCGGNSTTPPSPPPTTLTIAGVSVSPTSIAPGGTAQGSVTLSATTGSAVSLSSSNAGVATVPASVTVAAGATSASFTVTGVAAGTATISAAISGSQASTPITVTSAPTQALGLTLSAPSVVGGNPVTGTIILSSPAPAAGTVVSLSSSDPVTVPASVTVPAGQTTATFTVNTRAVGGTFSNVLIAATAGALSANATLTVTPVAPVVPTARFTVGGPSGTDTCKLTNNGNSFDCTFDGSASTASAGATVNLWNWTYTIAGTKPESTTVPTLSPTPGCNLIPPASSAPPGATSLQMTVTLQVRDSGANNSTVVTNANVKMLPNKLCGYAF
jgi:hypothetical protein